MTDTLTKPDYRQNPNPGHCRTCDADLAALGLNPMRQYCDEHRPERKRPGSSGGSTRRSTERVTPTQIGEQSAAETVREITRDISSSKIPKKPTVEATTKVVGKLVYYLFLVVVMSLVGSDPTLNDEQQEAVAGELSLSNEDAEAIARPLARLLTPTGFWQKTGPSIIENSDVVDALVAAYNAASGIFHYQRERKRREARMVAGNPAMNGHVPMAPPVQAPDRGPDLTVAAREGARVTVPESWGQVVDDKTIAEIRRRHGQPAPGEDR